MCWQMWSKYKHIPNAHVLYSNQSHAIKHGHTNYGTYFAKMHMIHMQHMVSMAHIVHIVFI
jgi:hypothetical protein